MKRIVLLVLAGALSSALYNNVLASEIDYTVITSDKIKNPTRYLEDGIAGVLGPVKPRRLDYRSEEARAWIKKLDIEFIPYVIFSRSIQESNKFFDLAKGGMIERKAGEYVIPDGMILPVGVMFFKRKLKPGQVDLFIMSQCPGGKDAVKFFDKYLTDNPKAFRLNYHYLADFDDFGIESMHGRGELLDDIYQILIQKYYPRKFFKYHVLYRNGKKFEEAAKEAGIDPLKIKAKLKEGIEILRKDSQLAAEYGIKSSPTFVWEGQVIFLSGDSFERFIAYNALDKIMETCPTCIAGAPDSPPPQQAAPGTVPPKGP